MKQKLALACSLMHAPEMLLLDEPTTGVDPVTRREFWRLLGELVAEGLTLVVATPYLDEAERCSRVILMHEGRILADARPAELRAALPGVVLEVEGTPRHVVLSSLSALRGVIDVQPFAARFHARFADPVAGEAVRAELERAGATVTTIREVAPTLEDAFLHLTRTGRPADTGEAA
jgi:ABC-2 type transport system ATP-binding protein